MSTPERHKSKGRTSMKKPVRKKTPEPDNSAQGTPSGLFPHVQEWEDVQAKKRAGVACDLDEMRRIALDAIATLEAAPLSRSAIAAVLDIAETACRAIHRLKYEHMMQDSEQNGFLEEVQNRHYIAGLHSSLPDELVPLEYSCPPVHLLKPYPLKPKRKAFKGDLLDSLAPVFVMRVLEGDTVQALGAESFLGRCPIPDNVRARLRLNDGGYDLGQWATDFVDWVLSNWPQSIQDPKSNGGKGGGLRPIVAHKSALGSAAVNDRALLRQAAREVLKPLLGGDKIKKIYNLS